MNRSSKDQTRIKRLQSNNDGVYLPLQKLIISRENTLLYRFLSLFGIFESRRLIFDGFKQTISENFFFLK